MDPVTQDALFTELYNDYRQPLYGYLRRLVGDEAHAEELVQDVFVRAYRALPGLGADPNYRAWLYRVATNAARDWFRRQRLRRWLAFDEGEDDEHRVSRPVADEGSPLPIEERLAVEDALNALPPIYRAPLLLYAVQGLATAEIAEVLGISRSAVKMRLSRGRSSFQRIYGGDGRHASTKTLAPRPGSLP